jgi:uncharacterized protein DUF4381
VSDDYAGLNLVDLLEKLEPIPEPETLSLLPQTQGWIWLGLLVIAVAVWLTQLILRARRASAYRRAALRELKRADSDPVTLAALLRRTALVAYPRTDVAGLYGADWLAFLDKAYGGTAFSAGLGRVFAMAPYREVREVDGLKDLVSEWIRLHGRKAGRAA